MGLRNWTPKVAFFGAVGSFITILFLIAGGELWKRHFRPAAWYFITAVALSVLFFRHRKIAFAIVALSFLFVNVGLNVAFHPTVAGLIVALGSIVGMYALAVWGRKKYPYLRREDWKTLFDHDP